MKRFLALYYRHAEEHNIKKEHMYIYAKDISEALSKWSAISSKNDVLVDLISHPTVNEQWAAIKEREEAR
jgi:hypothetical protein